MMPRRNNRSDWTPSLPPRLRDSVLAANLKNQQQQQDSVAEFPTAGNPAEVGTP